MGNAHSDHVEQSVYGVISPLPFVGPAYSAARAGVYAAKVRGPGGDGACALRAGWGRAEGLLGPGSHGGRGLLLGAGGWGLRCKTLAACTAWDRQVPST